MRSRKVDRTCFALKFIRHGNHALPYFSGLVELKESHETSSGKVKTP